MSAYLGFYKLNDLGAVARGKSRHRPRNDPLLYGGPYPFIQTGDVKHSSFYITNYTQTYNEKGLSQSKLWNPGTLCITIAANIADTAILAISACFPDSIIGFIPNKERADVRFVKYCLESYRLQMVAISQGTTQDNLSLEKLLSINFKVPPLATQRKIAAILSAYDDLIETNKRRIALLEKMAEEVYREWFVRMRFSNHRNTKIIKGVPEGWEHKRFGEFCMLKRGYDLPNELVEEGPYPVVASTSVKTYHKHYKVEPPVITTGRSGSLGDVLMTHTKAWPLNTVLFVCNFFGNSPFLVFYTLKYMGLEKFDSGAGVPTLNRNHVSGMPMVIPEKNLQHRFDGIVEPIHKQVENLRQENMSLNKTRDLLLPRLISGKLSVADLDIQFPPSMREGEEEAERRALDSTSESGQVHRG